MKRDNLELLIKDDVLDVNTLLEYLLERFKIILLTSWSNESIHSLKRLFNLILTVKKSQLAYIHSRDIEVNP